MMKTQEILSIVAMSSMGLCLILCLINKMMKKSKNGLKNGCGALILLAVSSLAVSQFLGESDMYTEKSQCGDGCSNGMKCCRDEASKAKKNGLCSPSEECEKDCLPCKVGNDGDKLCKKAGKSYCESL